jgi:hypothetical protein
MTIKLPPSDLKAIQAIKAEHPSLNDATAVSYALKKLAKEIRKAQLDRVIRF